jgi:hypothetical protein
MLPSRIADHPLAGLLSFGGLVVHLPERLVENQEEA